MEPKKKTVLEVEDLQKSIGLKGAAGRMLARWAYKFLEMDEVNRIHAKYAEFDGPEFSAHVLEEIGVSYEIPPEQLERIPMEGGFITVSNHHYGAVDGMILNTVIGARRPDYKILTTFLLALIPSLKESFIAVDNFSSGGARSISGIRTALAHLAGQKPLGFFPAGEVATWQKGKNRTAMREGKVVEDIPWAENIIKLVKKSGFPVIPIYFDGGNSDQFHRLGRIHPRLRTVRLIHEMFHMPGTKVRVRIGQPIPASEIESMGIPELGRYLRSRTYALEAQCRKETAEAVKTEREPLAEPVSPDLIRAEIDACKEKMLFEIGDYRAYLLHSEEAPATMKELYRLREETFREVGEGTGRPFDTDRFDAYYRQMVLWHVPDGQIAGAYRLGFGPEIMETKGGVPGFYSNTLYQHGEKAGSLLCRSLELGRSFIVRKYQREVHPLRLLLTGLAVCTLKSPEMEYYSGPVSISSDMPHFYKSLIVRFFEKYYKLPDASLVSQPTHPFIPDYLRVDPDDLLRQTDGDISAFDKLLGSLSDGEYRLPVLVRKYFTCGAKLVCFNVDPDFSDSLDALIFLRYADFPPQTLRSVLRGLPDELQDAVWIHFYGTPRI
ncbi:MAG: lysophospholipid acyltransferase family protein [Bacteroidales bacterium]|nr:lysophospholipid acyltransferase family protein [Bacteroidales bacterium]